MGCDIHWYSETRTDGEWVCDQADSFEMDPDVWEEDHDPYPEMDEFPGGSRDYWLFGLLNDDVRRSWPWSFEYQNHFPDDASPVVVAMYDLWGSDAHSASFKTQAELQAKLEELKHARIEFLINPIEEASAESIDHLIRRLEEIIGKLAGEYPPEDRRLVFWFDN